MKTCETRVQLWPDTQEDFESLLLEMDTRGYLCELKYREEVLKGLENEETEPP